MAQQQKKTPQKKRNLPKGILRINLKPFRQFYYVPCFPVQTCESLINEHFFYETKLAEMAGVPAIVWLCLIAPYNKAAAELFSTTFNGTVYDRLPPKLPTLVGQVPPY